MKGISPLPDFLGVLCKECEKPFLIWQTEYEGITPDDPDFKSYIDDGCQVKVISPEIVRDINSWCGGCGNEATS
jgi:hypothetical protein